MSGTMPGRLLLFFSCTSTCAGARARGIVSSTSASARPLTILHVSTERGWRGGERQVKLLTDGLAARGHRCLVLSPPEAALFRDRSQCGHPGIIPVPLRRMGGFDPFAARRLARLVDEEKVDIVHAQTSHAHSLACLAQRWMSAPVVVSRRVDFPVSPNFFSRRKYLDPRITYIAISEAVKQVLAASGIAPERIAVVHSGVSLELMEKDLALLRTEARSALELAPDQPLILNVAALTDHKDQATLLRAAALLRERVPAFRLVIAGSGELEEPLKRLASELSLESRVTFAGYVKPLDPLYAAADLFVMSSHLEGLCTSILDAMSAGIPVVATRTGGIPEIVCDGENGWLVPPRDPEALAEALARALADADRRARFAEAGRRTVLGAFTNNSMVEGTLKVYRGVLEKRQSPETSAEI